MSVKIVQKSFQAVGWRFKGTLAFFILSSLLIAGRVFYLAVIRHQYYLGLAENQHKIQKIVPSQRGKIFFQDRFGNKKVAAFSEATYDLAVSPKILKKPQDLAIRLGRIFGKDPKIYLSQLMRADDQYEIIEKDLSENQAEEVERLKIAGAVFVPSLKRLYPNGNFASSLLGFVGYAGEGEMGLYGVEKKFEDQIRGEAGFVHGEKDAGGSLLAIGKNFFRRPVNGSDIILTVDYNIQKKAEEELLSAQEKWEAESGLAIILNPVDGRLLALAVRPSYDPNEYFLVKNYQLFKNPAVESVFELGSVFKPVTMAAAINENVIRPETTYTDTGEVKIGGYKVNNFDNRAHGLQTMTQVLEQSLNTGAVFAGKLLGKQNFKKYVGGFGFGEKTGVDLPGEVSGNISNLGYNRDIDYATASFGQGIAVTPLQMAMAVSAIANKGILARPYIVDEIISDEERIKTNPEKIRQVIRPDTAETITKMLVSVVRNGFEGRGGVKGYFVAAKTGTAQIPSPDRRGYTSDLIHTLVGYAPAFNPKFLVYIQLNKPRGNRFAANTLTQPLHNLLEYLLNYYEIPPDEK